MSRGAWWRRPAGIAIGAALVAGLGGGGIAAAGSTPVHVTVDGRAVALGAPPVVIGGQVYLPAVDLAATLGVPATWNAHSGALAIGASAVASAHSFTFQGVRYGVAGLLIRSYPGAQSVQTNYWIVSYSATNTTKRPINVASTQPSLVLLGPTGAQFSPDATLSPSGPGTLNPELTFDGYLVFDVPANANPAVYALGFNAYRITGSGFTTTTLGAALPASASRNATTKINAPYALSGLWNSDVQDVLIRGVVQTNAVAPDLTPGSFDPTISVWVVDFGIDNPGPGTITFSASDFALRFAGSLSIAPYQSQVLPGYVQASDLDSSNGVTLAAGQVFNGALLFVVPGGTPTSTPQLVITTNGQERVVSAAPCPGGDCPAVQD